MVTDAHIHVQPWRQLSPRALERMAAGRRDLDLIRRVLDDPAEFLRFLDQQGIDRAVLVNYVSPDVIGFTDEVNDFVGAFCRGHEDRLVPMGGVHPRLDPDPAGSLQHIVEKHGIRALKLHPPHQHFQVNAYRDGGRLPGLAALYARAQELKVPVMIHTGTSIFPGARNVYGDPIGVDDVAVDFPDLTIILAHGGRPLWMEGIPPRLLPRYFPRLSEVADKALFGTDWPGPGVESPRRNLEEFRALPLAPEVKRALLEGTAERVFGRR